MAIKSNSVKNQLKTENIQSKTEKINWPEKAAKSWPAQDSPYQSITPVPESVFARFSICSPIGCMFQYEAWTHGPLPADLAGYFEYYFVANCFSEWLVRSEWDNSDEYLKPRDLLKAAKESKKCRYEKDIPIMEEVFDELEKAANAGDPQNSLEFLVKASEIFNNRWSAEKTWQFSFNIFRTPEEIGKNIRERYEEDSNDPMEELAETFDIQPNDWDKFWKTALKTTGNRAKLLDVLLTDVRC